MSANDYFIDGDYGSLISDNDEEETPIEWINVGEIVHISTYTENSELLPASTILGHLPNGIKIVQFPIV